MKIISQLFIFILSLFGFCLNKKLLKIKNNHLKIKEMKDVSKKCVVSAAMLGNGFVKQHGLMMDYFLSELYYDTISYEGHNREVISCFAACPDEFFVFFLDTKEVAIIALDDFDSIKGQKLQERLDENPKKPVLTLGGVSFLHNYYDEHDCKKMTDIAVFFSVDKPRKMMKFYLLDDILFEMNRTLGTGCRISCLELGTVILNEEVVDVIILPGKNDSIAAVYHIDKGEFVDLSEMQSLRKRGNLFSMYMEREFTVDDMYRFVFDRLVYPDADESEPFVLVNACV